MPRIQDGVERMTPEEIDSIAKEASKEFKKSKAAAPKELKTEGISKFEATASDPVSVGINVEKKAQPDKAIESKFKFVPCSKKGWIKMTAEESLRYSERGVLVGFDPANEIGLLNEGK